MAKSKHSHTKAPASPLGLTANILFLIEALLIIGASVYFYITNLIPIKYIFAVLGAGAVAAVLHILFLRSGTAKKALRIISVILSILIILISSFAVYFIGSLHSSFKDMDTDEDTEAVRVDVEVEPFIVYLSGVDTRGNVEIPDTALSDVNMTVVVNPKTAQILMVNTPRDSYLPLEGKKGREDKLTHAGNGGVECSMKTLGALYDIQYNYYAKTTFYSIVEMVDAIGGITVESEIAFRSVSSLDESKRYSFVKGANELDGRAALAFVRERASIPGGDRQRGKNQQLVLKAIINKATSPAMLPKINQLVDSVMDNIKTNITYSEVSTLVKYELAKTPAWQIKSMSVDGPGASKACYSTGSQLLSVITLDESNVEEAKIEIQKVLNGEPFTSESASEAEAGTASK